ncbi:hypothetical protein KL905_001177 [Ogataea polymorpha]|nr:hypothetical protein KL907_000404 [Ogataea polymorpha]KAG7922911.1 hypothetical protein KL905_001177 [Ogataea polymorpha]
MEEKLRSPKKQFDVPKGTSITITNDSQTSIAFKVKTTAPKLYCVRPNASIVKPGSSMDVSIIFQGLPKEPAIGTKCKDKFLIVSVPCSDDLDPKSVSTIWPELQSQAGSTTDVKVKVVFNYSSLTNTIQEESSQQSKSDDRDTAVLAAAPLANGHSGVDEKPVSEKKAVSSDDVLPETMPLAPATTDNKEAAAAVAPAKQEPATSSTSSNVYVVAVLLVIVAVMYAKFML